MLEPCRAADLAQVAAMLARAFHDNPGVRALLPDDPPEVRLRLTERAMRGFTRAALHAGRAEIARQDGRVVGASLAFPPGAFPPGLSAELRMVAGLLGGGPRRILRFRGVDRFMRERHLREPHWYLWVLGVEPEYQGRGIGSALLCALNEVADRDGVPCWLETDKHTSVRLYERHGYTVRSEEVHRPLDLRLWFMQRATP